MNRMMNESVVPASRPSRVPRLVAAALAVLGLSLTACSSGGGSSSTISGTSGDFVVLRTNPQNNGQLFLNEPIQLDFSTPVDLGTADLNSIAFQVFDLTGNPVVEQVSGTFRVARAAGDELPGRRLEFVPRFASNDTYDNGGFRPARRYLVQLLAGDHRQGTVLRDVRGKGLRQAVSFEFSTPDGTTPAQLFRDTQVGGPRRVSFTATPQDDAGLVSLNLLGQTGVELRLEFNQPLDPHSENVPYTFDPDPLQRSISDRGRIFLEYDDVDPARGSRTWIPTAVDLEVNDLEHAVVVLRPIGVLPNNARVRVIVENTLQDMAGESNVADAAYSRVFAEFQTRPDYRPLFDAVIETFDSTDNLDLAAPFVEPLAQVQNGVARASFAFEGTNTILDYEPQTREVVLNTDFTQIVPKGSPPINVSGGVFQFRNVRIPPGVTVRGTGTKPMVWLVTNDFTVEGELTVRGGDGARVDTLNSANFPTAGGIGTCGGGNGGKGSPETTRQTPKGEDGFGANQVPGGGGRGGVLSYVTSCGRGSAGGGGANATQGDPWFHVKTTGATFPQQRGIGGFGCTSTRTLAGGNPGPTVFRDSRVDNNFWGFGVNLQRQIRIPGELFAPVGGQGGGGGGDTSTSLNNPNWINDRKGGGGGAGGGVLIIKALGKITVGPVGRINADGGHGGGGEQAGSNDTAGGGGAGAGGMVVLMSATAIELHKHGRTYAEMRTNQNDATTWSYSVSADGGICRRGVYVPPEVAEKYPLPSSPGAWDLNPTGGMGGMGIVQLMAPAGDNSEDNTNTILDDNIRFIDGTTLMSGTEKIRYLAWRGLPNAAGAWVGDDNTPTYQESPTTRDNEGDIRPAPILLPSPINSKSRFRSKWRDTGFSVRRELPAPDGNPRGIVTDPGQGLLGGPDYEFAGTNTQLSTPTFDVQGYVDYESDGGNGVRVRQPRVATGEVTALVANAVFDGRPAYRIEVAAGSSTWGTIQDRYAQYTLRLVNVSGTSVGEFRILGHDRSVAFVSPESGALPPLEAGMRGEIIAKFFQVVTDEAVGLGRAYLNANREPVPFSNVRIGFAFHQDPRNPQLESNGTIDRKRIPEAVNTFLYDIEAPAVQAMMRTKRPAFVQFDLTFNMRFSEDPRTGNINEDVVLSPSSPRPGLTDLRIPYRL